MRRSVALLAMALGIVPAGSALAADATRVVYDLSGLRSSPAAVSQQGHNGMAVPMRSLPLATPSLGGEQPSDLEGYVGHGRQGSHRGGNSANAPRGGKDGHDNGRHNSGHGHNNPGHPNGGGPDNGNGNDNGRGQDNGNGNDGGASPNPEPGSFLLLGSALASGARFLRRR